MNLRASIGYAGASSSVRKTMVQGQGSNWPSGQLDLGHMLPPRGSAFSYIQKVGSAMGGEWLSRKCPPRVTLEKALVPDRPGLDHLVVPALLGDLGQCLELCIHMHVSGLILSQPVLRQPRWVPCTQIPSPKVETAQSFSSTIPAFFESSPRAPAWRWGQPPSQCPSYSVKHFTHRPG